MEYGLQIEPAYGFTYEEALEAVETAQQHGYTSAWSSDHLFLGENEPDRSCMDCWTLLAGLARDTSGIRLGSMVTCVTYRNPALLAKIAATVDVMSNGRLTFGIGAGWNEVEHNAYGYEFPGVGQRIERLREAVEIIRGLWTERYTSFEGQYYSVDNAAAAPKPVQNPHPPILIGGSGPRLLRTAARFADCINMGSGQSPESYAAKLEVLRSMCDKEGTDFDRIKPSHLMSFIIGSDASDLEDTVGRAAAFDGISKSEFVSKNTNTYIGTAAGAVDAVKKYQDAGVREMITRFPYGDEKKSIQLMAEEVMPRV
jgi:F420-dependent oxidoreductase-like protein